MAEENTEKQEQKVSTAEEIAEYNEQSLAGGEITAPEPVISVDDKSSSESADDKKDPDKGVTPEKGESASEEQKTNEKAYNPIWDQIAESKKANGEEWSIPESVISGKTEDDTELTSEMEYDMLQKAMTPEPVEQKDEDPFIASYKEARKEEGFDREEWLKRNNETNTMLSLPSKEFLKKVLENQKTSEGERKYTDEVISEHLDEKNQIDLDREADTLKEQYKVAVEERVKSQKIENKDRVEKAKNTFIEEREKETSNLLDDMSSVEKIGGLPHGEAEQKAFKPFFEKLMAYDTKTDSTALTDFFNGRDIKGTGVEQNKAGNQRLYKALYLLYQAEDGGADSYLSNFKEEYKQSILDKTDTAPRKQSGKVAVETPPTDTGEEFVI